MLVYGVAAVGEKAVVSFVCPDIQELAKLDNLFV